MLALNVYICYLLYVCILSDGVFRVKGRIGHPAREEVRDGLVLLPVDRSPPGRGTPSSSPPGRRSPPTRSTRVTIGWE